jgi:hypothetical protein
MTEDARPRVKSKSSTKFIENTAKHPDWWDLVKGLSQRIAEVPYSTLRL